MTLRLGWQQRFNVVQAPSPLELLLQRDQLLSVLMASLIVGGNGSGVGRERNPCGGRISMSGGFGQFAISVSVVQADKATVDSASSIGLNGHIDGNLLDDGVALLVNDADVVVLLDDDLDGGLRLPLADGGDSSLKQFKRLRIIAGQLRDPSN